MAKESRAAEIAWLRFIALELRPSRARAVLQAVAYDPAAVFEASDQFLRDSVPTLAEKHRQRIHEMKTRSFEKEADALERVQARILTDQDPAYPANLRELPDAPAALMVRGELRSEDKFSIAIVGSRRASQYGRSLAERFARELAAHGLTVVSGGARGVDTCAHEGTLDGGGRTIAYLGCGVDIAYPSENQRLFARIADGGGAVVSEFSIGTRPEPWRFPARNRLISGTALGICKVSCIVKHGVCTWRTLPPDDLVKAA